MIASFGYLLLEFYKNSYMQQRRSENAPDILQNRVDDEDEESKRRKKR